MAFFGLFGKKKKEKPHKKLKGAGGLAASSPSRAPPPPPAPPVPPPAAVVQPLQSNGGNTFMAMDSIREESLYTKTGFDTTAPRKTTTTTTTEQQPHMPAPSPTTVPPTPQTVRDYEANQAAIDLTRSLVKRFIADIWNRGEVDLIPEVCSPSLRFNGNTGFDRVGHEGLARMVNTIREALDDYHCEIHSMVVEHNKAFCRLRFTGKHTGNLLGYPPTKKVVAWMGATEFTCQNGKILKVWELGDIKTLEEQLTNIVEQDEV